MITIKNLTELRGVFAHGPIFVRWTSSLQKDRKRGHSVDWSSRSAETGLSVLDLPEPDGPERDEDAYLIRVLMSYAFLRYRTGQARPYLLTGEVVGTGGDNEPLLAPGWETIARLSPKFFRAALAYATDYSRIAAKDSPWRPLRADQYPDFDDYFDEQGSPI